MFCQNKNGYEVLGDKLNKEIFEFSQGYKAFLDQAKIEREAVDYTIKKLLENGFSGLI